MPSAFGDLLCLVRQLLEVLSPAVLRHERIRPPEAPTGEPDPDPSVDPLQLTTTRRAGRRGSAKGLDLFVGGAAALAAVFVERH